MNKTMQASAEKRVIRPRVHWHVFFAHFPVSLFAVCAGFQILHLFMLPTCLEIAGNICLVGATLALIPTTLSGWLTWKNQYRGFGSPLFLKKRTIAFFMLGLSFATLVLQFVFIRQLTVHVWNVYHWLYFSATMLLFSGAVLEGYFGGTLHHR